MQNCSRVASGKLFAILAAVILMCSGLLCAQMQKPASNEVIDDSAMTAAVTRARDAFLAGKPFNRCDVAVLVKDTSSTQWRRGQVNGSNLSYTASAIKLAYLTALMHRLHESGQQPNALDAAARPMIEKSDNFQTGMVVDAITQAPNIADITTTSDPRYAPWLEKRKYTMNFLRAEGVLGDQVLIHKTYPTNSGNDLVGAEKLARADMGMNTLQPVAAAELMRRIATGTIEPQATRYMMDLLSRDRWQAGVAAAPGFPPGTHIMSKAGWAYSNANDIVYGKLPGGTEVIIAILTNGFVQPYKTDPPPHEKSVLSEFAELLLLDLGLIPNADEAYLDTSAQNVQLTGDWQRIQQPGCYPAGAPGGGKSALVKHCAGNSRVVWKLPHVNGGIYEICVAYPQAADRTTSATYVVHHTDGTSTVTINQQKVGGRWNLLGNFRLSAGSAAVELLDVGSPANTVAAGAIRVLPWPAQ